MIDFDKIQQPTEIKMYKNTDESINALNFLCNPQRETFLQFLDRNPSNNLFNKILPYFSELGLSSEAKRNACQIKEEMFYRINKNDHKRAMTGVISQAYFDLCSFLDIYVEDKPLPIEKKIKTILFNLDEIFSRVIEGLSILNYKGRGEYITQDNKQILISRVENALNIVELWQHDSIEYTKQYESFSSVDISFYYLLHSFVFPAMDLIRNKKEEHIDVWNWINSIVKSFDSELDLKEEYETHCQRKQTQDKRYKEKNLYRLNIEQLYSRYENRGQLNAV